jgi:hypothetical protein
MTYPSTKERYHAHNDNHDWQPKLPKWFVLFLLVGLIYAIVSFFLLGKHDAESEEAHNRAMEELRQPVKLSHPEATIWWKL